MPSILFHVNISIYGNYPNLSSPYFMSRYLVPRDMSVGQFIHVLSNRLHVAPGRAIFVFVKNTLPPTGIIY